MKKWKSLAMVLCLSFAFGSAAAGCDLFEGEESSTESSSSSESSSSVPEIKTLTTSFACEADVQFAQTEGGFNAYVELEMKQSGISLGEYSLYLIDGFLYVYNATDGSYWKSSSTITSELSDTTGESDVGTAALSAALAESVDTASGVTFDVADLQAVIGTYVDMSVSVKDGVTTVTLDAKDSANELLDYLSSLKATTTVGAVINDVLSLVDPALTYSAIFDDLIEFKSVTVNEAYESLSELATTEYETTLQEIKDALVNNETTYGLLVSALGEEAATMIKEAQLDEFLTDYGAYTVEEILVEMIGGMIDGETENSVTLEQIFEWIETEKLEGTTLGDIDADTVAMFATLSTVEVSELNVVIAMEYDGETLEKAVITLNVGVRAQQSATLVQEYKIAVKMNVEAVEAVSLPAGATVYYSCYDCGKTSELESTVRYYETLEKYLCVDCAVEHGADQGVAQAE